MVAALASILLLALPDSGLGQEPMAILMEFRGDVQVASDSAGGSEDESPEPAFRDARLGMNLAAGDRIRVPEGGRAVILHRSGEMTAVSSSFALTASGIRQDDALFRSVRGTLAEAERAGPPRGEPGRRVPGPSPLRPARGVTVLDLRPEFRWTSDADVPDFTLELRREDADEARRYEVGSGDVWRYPRSEPPLTPGVTYRWRIVEGASDRRGPPTTFAVAGSEAMAKLRESRERMREAGVDPDEEGLFLSALLYQDLGLAYEALSALDRLSERRPDAISPEVHLLRARVLERAGRYAEARQAYERAGRGR